MDSIGVGEGSGMDAIFNHVRHRSKKLALFVVPSLTMPFVKNRVF
jgi:hypothetical protein